MRARRLSVRDLGYPTAMTIRLERSYLQVPYRAVRTPLGLLDDLVVVRVFGADSPAHRVLAQKLQQLDSLAAAAFGDDAAASAAPQPAPKAAARKAAPTATAPTAAPTPEAAPDTSDADERDRAIPADEQDEIEHLAESFVADEALVPRAGELAENDELRRVQAEIKAKQSVEDERGQL